MELSDLDPLPIRDDNNEGDEENEDENEDSFRADEEGGGDGGERIIDSASSYTSGTSDSDVWFVQAASEGNLVQVKRFVNGLKKGDLKKFAVERDRLVNGYSALHMAARYNKCDVVDYLLDNNAPMDQKDEEDENTPLLLAIK